MSRIDNIRPASWKPVSLFLAVILVDIGMIAYQWHEICRFDAEIAEHVPTMADPYRSDWVSTCFERGVVFGPFLIQPLFVPLGIWLAWKIAGQTSRRWGLVLAVIVLALAVTVWWGSLTGFGYLVGAWD